LRTDRRAETGQTDRRRTLPTVKHYLPPPTSWRVAGITLKYAESATGSSQ